MPFSLAARTQAAGGPYFIAAGIRRPHRVWHVPKRFYDLYANNGTFPTCMPLAKFKTGPVGMPEIAYIDNAWPTFPYNQSTPIPDSIAALGRWGYYASVSFTDFNLGVMLKALDDLELANNTIVTIVGDHGWELGEHGEWCKRTNFEVGLRIPFMIRAPHMPASVGRQTRQLAEALDLYRTLASLAGFTPEQIEPGVEGTDLSPVFADPSTVIKTAAFSQMARCPQPGTLGPESACNSVARVKIGCVHSL
jgi:iduronate 2-sulfatase